MYCNKDSIDCSSTIKFTSNESTSNNSKLLTGSRVLKWNVCMTRGKLVAPKSDMNIPEKCREDYQIAPKMSFKKTINSFEGVSFIFSN